MKLIVTAGLQRYSVDLPESECNAYFHTIISYLLKQVTEPGYGCEWDGELVEDDDFLEEPSVCGQPIISEQAVSPAALKEDEPRADTAAAAQGFLYYRCPHCNEAVGFCSKYSLTFYKCKACGKGSDIDLPLAPLYVNCECGKSFRYLTNMTDALFDMPCLGCGTPVPVGWSDKKQAYTTIR